jgi:serine/threonine protein kinase
VLEEQAVATATSTAGGPGNPRWLAPEVVQGGTATAAADVYSFGIVLWELLSLQLPWGRMAMWSIVGEVLAGKRLPVPPPEACPGFGSYAPYVALLQACWAQQPEDRPSFETICAQLGCVHCSQH